MSWFTPFGNINSFAFSSSSQNFSDEVQRLAKDFGHCYSTSATNQQTLTYIADFIERAKKKYPNTLYQSLLGMTFSCPEILLCVDHIQLKSNIKQSIKITTSNYDLDL